MKTKIVILFCFLLTTCITAPGWCQPELVCLENGSERRVDGVENTKPYYMDSGEKKYFDEGDTYYLRKNDADIISSGLATVSYIVRDDSAIVIVIDESRKSAWNRLEVHSLLKLWDEDTIENSLFFLCWYDPKSELLKVGELRKMVYYDGELHRVTLSVDIESMEPGCFPVIFLWDNNGPVAPKSYIPDNEEIFHSVISA